MPQAKGSLAHAVQAASLGCLLGTLAAQDDAALADQVFAALGGKQCPGARLGLVDERAPTCPCCGKPLREVALWRERGGMDAGGARVTALVCTDDALFSVRSREQGMGRNWDAGPFALPRPGEKPARRCLPWGAEPLPDENITLPAPTTARRSRDGSVVVGGEDTLLKVWSHERTLFEDRGEMGVTASALSDDGRLLAFARSQGPVRVITLATGKECCCFRPGPVNVMSIAFEPGGQRLVFTAMACGGQGTLELGSTSGGRTRTLGQVQDEAPVPVAWLPRHGTVVMGAFDGSIRALSLDGSGERWSASLGRPVEDLAAAPDGARLCATGNAGLLAMVLDGAKGGVERRAAIARMAECDLRGSSVAWSSDSRSYAWVLGDGRIARGEVSDVRGLQVSPGSAELCEVAAVRLSFTGAKEVVTATLAGTRLRWQVSRFPPLR